MNAVYIGLAAFAYVGAVVVILSLFANSPEDEE